jgi:hypothetical protein
VLVQRGVPIYLSWREGGRVLVALEQDGTERDLVSGPVFVPEAGVAVSPDGAFLATLRADVLDRDVILLVRVADAARVELVDVADPARAPLERIDDVALNTVGGRLWLAFSALEGPADGTRDVYLMRLPGGLFDQPPR